MPPDAPLRIVHCFRSPVGGIFRHVRDLCERHSADGHRLGVVCDSIAGGPLEEAQIEAAHSHLALGLKRVPIHRSVGLPDIAALGRCGREMRRMRPDIVHGHGAKGGAFARLARLGRGVTRIYSMHGGSLHYDPARLSGKVYFALERLLERRTDGMAFVSAFERQAYLQKVGTPQARHRLIRNGLPARDFTAVEPAPDAADFLYVGMMRHLKGPDVFIRALARARSIAGKPLSAVMVGDGDEKPIVEALLADAGLGEHLTMRPAMPIGEALGLGRIVVVPSRAESMPYLVLEALAAGRPVIATTAGGIPEIFGADTAALVPPDNAGALAERMALAASEPDRLNALMPDRDDLRRRFSVGTMAAETMRLYRECRWRSRPGEKILTA